MAAFKLHDVFISYRRYEDEEKNNPQGLILAQAVYNYLTGKGLKVFWDKPEMEPGDFEAQLDWQLEHCPNYIFIATESAKHFRKGEKDYVEHELKTVFKLYDSSPEDRVILPVFPYMAQEERQAAANNDPYPEEIQRLVKFHGVDLGASVPSKDELGDILRYVTLINRGNIWNAGYQWLRQAKQNRFKEISINEKLISYAGRHEDAKFPDMDRRENRDEFPLLDEVWDAKTHLYLIGEGGIGKTTVLLRIMEEAYDEEKSSKGEQNRLNGQIPLFIELSRAPDVIPDDIGNKWQVYASGRSTFIHREIYRQVRRDLKLRQIHDIEPEETDDIYKVDYEVAVRPIANLLGRQTPAPEYLLLLDGLNEVSRCEIEKYTKQGKLEFSRSVVSMVLDEIREIMKYKNVRVILTSRSEEAVLLTEDTKLLDLSGVRPETISKYLADKHVQKERIEAAMNSDKLRKVLRTPLFLIMYAELDGKENLLTAGEIMRVFYHFKSQEHYTQAMRVEEVQNDIRDSSENAVPSSRIMLEMTGFILDHILPEIAWRMTNSREFRIRRDFMADGSEGLDSIIEHVLTDKDDESVCGRYGRYAFPEYTNETWGDITRFAGRIIKCLGGIDEAVDAILYCLVYTLGVLYKSDDGYRFTHHHRRDYFSAVYHINRLKLAVYLQERGKGDKARAVLSEWKKTPLPAITRQFIGEALGEAHNIPWCDGNGCWHYNVPQEKCERNLLKRAFDIYRGRMDGLDGYSVWNLLQILKETRVDFSGEDFSQLDLRHCEANGHFLGRRGLASIFTGAILDEQFFMPEGHEDRVNSAVYSPDGRRIVTASADSTVKVWDAETLQLIGTLNGHKDICYSALYNRAGDRIVTTSFDGTAKVWDAETLQLIGTLFEKKSDIYSDLYTPVFSASYSPAGDRIVTVSESYNGSEMLVEWDAETLQPIGTPSRIYDRFAVYSPDGRRIVTASAENTVTVWDAETLQPIGTLRGHKDYVRSAAYSPNGRRIVTTSKDNTAKVWDAEMMKLIGTLSGHEDCVGSVVYSPDGHRIVTASDDKTAKVWDAETMELIGTLSGHKSIVRSAAYSPDGRKIVTASWDKSVKVWDAETLQLIGSLYGTEGGIQSAVYDSDRRRILTASDDGTAKVWDAETLKLVGTLSGHKDNVLSAVFNRDGDRIVTASRDGTAKVWNAKTLRLISTLDGNKGGITSAVYSLDESNIVTTYWDNTANVWDAETMQPIGTLSGNEAILASASYSPDGSRIVTASRKNNTAKVCDDMTLQLISSLSGDIFEVCISSFSSDRPNIMYYQQWIREVLADEISQVISILSRYKDAVFKVLCSSEGSWFVEVLNQAMVWDARTLQLLGVLKGHRDEAANSAVYSPDGHRIVTASDNTVMVWDAETLNRTSVLNGHKDEVRSAVFSPDGQRIVTASKDGTCQIWDVSSRTNLHTMKVVPGLEVMGVDLRHLHSDSHISDETSELLYKHGAIV